MTRGIFRRTKIHPIITLRVVSAFLCTGRGKSHSLHDRGHTWRRMLISQIINNVNNLFWKSSNSFPWVEYITKRTGHLAHNEDKRIPRKVYSIIALQLSTPMEVLNHLKVPCLYNGNHLDWRVNESSNIYTLRNHKVLTFHSGPNHGDCAAWKYF